MNWKCRLGFHKFIDTDPTYITRSEKENLFYVIKMCERCKKDVVITTIETPFPSYMKDWGFKFKEE